MAWRGCIVVALGMGGGVTGAAVSGAAELDHRGAGLAQPVPTATYSGRRSAVLAAAGGAS